MNRQTVYGALIAGALLVGPALPSAVAFAEDGDMTSPADVTEVVDFDQDETFDQDGTLDEGDTPDAPEPGEQGEPSEGPQPGKPGRAPQGQAGPKYGPNIDGWVVRVTNTGKGKLALQSPSWSDNVANMSPGAGSEFGAGQTANVKGKQSASSAFGGKEPANMNFRVKDSNRGLEYTVTVRDSPGYDSPAKVDCTTGLTGGKCQVTSNAKNREITVEMASL